MTNQTSTLSILRAQFLAAVEALIAQYPGQAQNRAHYVRWAESAQLGETTRRIRTKGGYTDVARGALVLFAANPYAAEDGLALEMWAPRADGKHNQTLVDAKTVRPVCPTCEGSGVVLPHPTALVTVNCPSCR